jgi:type VI protein secretion system component Hcp
MARWIAAFGVLCLAVGPLAGAAAAGPIYLDIPSIAGEDSIPGHSGVMAVSSLTVKPHEFQVVKNVDIASPHIASAVLLGTPLSNASVFFFNSTPAGPADATLSFQNLVASSYQILPGNTPTERDGFNFAPTMTMFLELPGITGESSTPGHPGVIPIQSFSVSGDFFSVVKAVDSTSPTLFLDALDGKSLAAARVLLYDSAPTGQPDVILEFRNLVDSGYSLQEGVDLPTETDRFNFGNILSVPVPPTTGTSIPEPASLTLLVLGLASLGVLGRANARKTKLVAAEITRQL